MKFNLQTLFTFYIILFFQLPLLQSQSVMMQGWYWDYPKSCDGHSWADSLRLKAPELAEAGITHLWFPPHAVSSSGPCSNGYNPKDLYIGNQTTGLGTRTALDAMLDEYNAQGIMPVGDMIYNHRDGGAAENNTAVKDYITNHYDASKNPFPSDRFRCVIPIGGSTGIGAGNYYFKVSSKTGDARFHGKPYTFYTSTDLVNTFSGLPDLTENEPNGGAFCCGEGTDVVELTRNMKASVDGAVCCNVDEFQLTLTAADFDAAGDNLYIYLTNDNGDYSDHRVYEIYYDGTGSNIVDQMSYQTYTDFSGCLSGRGGMNFECFKPNSNNASTIGLNNEQDAMYFFYDYDQYDQQTKDSLFEWTKWNWLELGVRGLRMDAIKHFPAEFVGDLLDFLHDNGIDPDLVVGEWYGTNATELSNWVNEVLSFMDTDTQAAIFPKIFDFTLRENLRQACDEFGYDARNLFTGSLRDQAGLSGFNVVTFVNNHDFRDGSGFASLIHNDPILAYAYILTNNQLGTPTIFYPDYYGYPSAPFAQSYHPADKAPLQSELDRLMEAHQLYIFNSTMVDYLSRIGTPYASTYIEGGENTTLLYQLSGGIAGREVIVGINFAGETLKVDHVINTANIVTGDTLTDVLGNSNFPFAIVDGSNRMYVELPPRSFSVWVEGDLPVIGACRFPENIVTTSVGDTDATVGWSSVSSANSYTIRYQEVGETTWTEVAAATNTTTLSGLSVGTEYAYQVQSICDAASEWSDSYTFTTTCPVPDLATALVISGNVVKLTWTAIPNIQKFRIQFRPVGAPWQELNSGYPAVFLNGLMENTTYEYRTKTTCDALSSVWSATSIFTTSSDTCDRPESSTTSNITSSSAVIAWPSDPDDLKYKMKYKIAGGSWTEIFINNTTTTLSGLTASSNYKYKLKSKCALGWTNWAAKNDFSTSALLPDVNARITSDKPTFFDVFPNPAKTLLYLNIQNSNIQQIQISNLNAQILFEEKTNLVNEINIEQLPSGMYILSVLTEEGEWISKRFVKAN